MKATKFVYDIHAGTSLSIAINLTDSLLHGLSIDTKTINFWKRQPTDAKLEITRDAMKLDDALSSLTQFIEKSEPELTLWCRGSSFDFPILKNAYAAVGFTEPWKYWQERDMRTILHMCKHFFGYAEPSKNGTAHSAHDDCIHQIGVLSQCVNLIRGLQK